MLSKLCFNTEGNNTCKYHCVISDLNECVETAVCVVNCVLILRVITHVCKYNCVISDLNECVETPAVCFQLCINTEGNYIV